MGDEGVDYSTTACAHKVANNLTINHQILFGLNERESENTRPL
jgi:hypothetical protein